MNPATPKILIEKHGIQLAVLTELASRADKVIWRTETSTWAAGRRVSPAKQRRLNGALAALVDVLTTPHSQVPNLNDADSCRESIAALKKLRAEEAAALCRAPVALSAAGRILATPDDRARCALRPAAPAEAARELAEDEQGRPQAHNMRKLVAPAAGQV